MSDSKKGAGRGNTKRAEILKVSMQGFLRHGYHGFTMSQIGEAVKLSKGSLYSYVNNKLELAMLALEALMARFNEVSFGEERKKLYSLPDGETLALLPLMLLESDDDSVRTKVKQYYHCWAEHFVTCGDRLDDTIKNWEQTSNHYSFWAWLGFWVMAHVGGLPITPFERMRSGGGWL